VRLPSLKISATEEVMEMTVFVAIEVFQGMMDDVNVFLTQKSAEKA